MLYFYENTCFCVGWEFRVDFWGRMKKKTTTDYFTWRNMACKSDWEIPKYKIIFENDNEQIENNAK